MRRPPIPVLALSLLLALALAGCAGDAAQDVAVTEPPAATATEGAAGAAEDPVSDPKEEDEGAGVELESTEGDEDKQTPELSTAESIGLMSLDGRVCDQLPLAAIRELIGEQAEASDTTPDQCTYTAIDGAEVTIVNVSRTEFTGDAALFETLVATVAESLDRDMTPEVIPGLGDQAYLLDGELGTYTHARRDSLYVTTLVTGPADGRAIGEALARLSLGS